jgi:hypothetical protein
MARAVWAGLQDEPFDEIYRVPMERAVALWLTSVISGQHSTSFQVLIHEHQGPVRVQLVFAP